LNSYPGAFAQIYTNLIQNSLIHGFLNMEKGNINIIVMLKNGGLEIQYRDNGKGIKEDILPNIFEPFQTSDPSKGPGLGLNIVYNLVTQKLKGTIKCENLPRKGTSFTILIQFAL
jgi:signal transduction histidine kinase